MLNVLILYFVVILCNFYLKFFLRYNNLNVLLEFFSTVKQNKV